MTDEAEPEEFQFASDLINARLAAGVSQETLAKSLTRQDGTPAPTTQHSISDIEMVKQTPRFRMMLKIARALRKRLRVEFVDC